MLQVGSKITLDLYLATMIISDLESDTFGVIHKQYRLLEHIGNYKNVSIEEGITNMLNVYVDKIKPNERIILENKSAKSMNLNLIIIK